MSSFFHSMATNEPVVGFLFGVVLGMVLMKWMHK